MDKVIIAEMGVEGGGVTIYGRQVDGVWSFWQEGSSMDLDENDDEVWRDWSSDPVTDLLAALPGEWWTMYPTEVHLAFVAEFRGGYERCCGTEDGHASRFQHGRWAELLVGRGQDG